MHVVITGSSGLIGSALSAALSARGDRVVGIGRGADAEVRWDPARRRLDPGAFAGADAVVHLAAEPLGDAEWTPECRRRTEESRVRGTTLVASTMAAMSTTRPRVLVSASATGWYGDRGDEIVTEASGPPRHPGFLAAVCAAWEGATTAAAAAGIRTVVLRIGSVLDGSAGMLATMVPLFRLGVAGPVPPGDQFVSWISLADVVGSILHVIDDGTLAGPVNATAPAPVTNQELTALLAAHLGVRAEARIPIDQLQTLFGADLVRQVLVEGRRVVPERLVASGYRFRHGRLEDALRWALP